MQQIQSAVRCILIQIISMISKKRNNERRVMIQVPEIKKSITPDLNFEMNDDSETIVSNENLAKGGKVEIAGIKAESTVFQFNEVQNMSLMEFSGKQKQGESGNTSKIRKKYANNRQVIKIIQKERVKNIVNNFVNKLSRSRGLRDSNELHCEVISFSESNNEEFNGLKPPLPLFILNNFLSITNIFSMLLLCSMGLIFNDQMQGQEWLLIARIFMLLFLFLEIIQNFVTVVNLPGKTIEKLNEIAWKYFREQFWVDLLCFIILIIDLTCSHSAVKIFRLVFTLKLRDLREKIYHFEFTFVTGFYAEQYWGLIKILLQNFIFAHFIAIVLLMMSSLEANNWLTKFEISDRLWFEQYVWAYYWAVTTMLTVGYGDFSAANYKQALCLIFVETFSCIVLAYTINCVGNIMNGIRSNDEQKNKNFKIFKKIKQKNVISKEIENKAIRCIAESIEIRRKFNYEQEKKLLAELPQDTKNSLLQQCNFKLFQKINIFSFISCKTIMDLAIKITMVIVHHDQTLLDHAVATKIQILKEGKIGYYTLAHPKQVRFLMNQVQVLPNEDAKPLSLSFISREIGKYCMQSIGYSIIYEMDIEEMVEVIRKHDKDLQNYCILKDKCKHILNEFETVPCSLCPTNHTKATCSKLHYNPIKQMVIFKSLSMDNRNTRVPYRRMKVEIKYFQNRRFKMTPCVSRAESEMDPKSESNIQSMFHIANTTNSNAQKTRDDKQRCSLYCTNNCIFEQFNRVDCDELKDYENYFPQFNPIKLKKSIALVSQVGKKSNMMVKSFDCMKVSKSRRFQVERPKYKTLK